MSAYMRILIIKYGKITNPIELFNIKNVKSVYIMLNCI